MSKYCSVHCVVSVADASHDGCAAFNCCVCCSHSCRFCQQCGRLEPLSCFLGAHRYGPRASRQCYVTHSFILRYDMLCYILHLGELVDARIRARTKYGSWYLKPLGRISIQLSVSKCPEMTARTMHADWVALASWQQCLQAELITGILCKNTRCMSCNAHCCALLVPWWLRKAQSAAWHVAYLMPHVAFHGHALL